MGALENGNNAYLVQLPGLKTTLGTSRYLMDESTGQFHAIYGNSYQTMSTHPRLFEPWVGSQLLDELAATRHQLGMIKDLLNLPHQHSHYNPALLVKPAPVTTKMQFQT